MADIAIPSDVREAVDRIAAATKAQAVVLFGSRARGDHTEDSDWDLAVILPDDADLNVFTPTALHMLVRDREVGFDIRTIRHFVFEQKRTVLGTLSHQIAQDGKLLAGSLFSIPKIAA